MHFVHRQKAQQPEVFWSRPVWWRLVAFLAGGELAMGGEDPSCVLVIHDPDQLDRPSGDLAFESFPGNIL